MTSPAARALVVAACLATGLGLTTVPAAAATLDAAAPSSAPAATGATTAPATLSGSLSPRRAVLRGASVRAGMLSAELRFTGSCERVGASVWQRGRLVAAGSGASGLALAGRVARGRVLVRVGAPGCSGTWTVELTTTPQVRTPRLIEVAGSRTSGSATSVRLSGRRTAPVRVPAGAVTAVATAAPGCRIATVSLVQGRRVLARGTGRAGLALGAHVSTGRATVQVLGGGCRRGWTVTVRTPAQGTPSTFTTVGYRTPQYIHADGADAALRGVNVMRTSNSIVMYTRTSRQSVTPTGSNGLEATVVGGVVVAVSDRMLTRAGATAIPSAGYVVSGNGTGREWLLAHTPLGTMVSIDATPTSPAPTTTSPAPTTTTPAPTTTSPAPTTTTPAPTTTSPAPTTTTPAPTTTSPAPTTTTPAPTTTSPAPTTTTPAPTTTSPAPTTTTPAPTTTSPAPTTTTPAPTGRTLAVESYGAVGDGVTDDTAAIRRAFDAMRAGDTLVFAAGRTYVHSDVLRIRVAGTRFTGGGTLLATKEAGSSFMVQASNVTVEDLTLRLASSTVRWEAAEQMKLYIGSGISGIRVSRVLVDHSGAAGVYVGYVTDFVLTDLTVQNTRADAIHITGGSNNGQVVRPIVRNPGDDGVAVVSYKNDGRICHHIAVVSPRLYGQKWGRAFSVVGGQDITETDIYADGSGAAAIYIAAESEWNTYGNSRVTFDGGSLLNSNTISTVDHGAVLLYNSQDAATPNTDIAIRNLTIKDTRTTASRQLGLVQYNGGTSSRVTMANIAIIGGNKWLFSGNAPSTSTNRTGWTWNGAAVSDAIGWR